VVENRVILHAPGNRSATWAAHRFFEQITNDIATSTSRVAWPARGALYDFVISRRRLRDYLPRLFRLEPGAREKFTGMIRMNQFVNICFGVALTMTLAPVAGADEFRLSNNQRISCSRGLSAGKLNTATCKSYAYIFNARTSEYFRCQISLALTRDNKEVINVQADGNCVKKPRIFETDSSYSFDATETEPPNTNSFFGPGGYSIWASDNTAQKVRGCITISSGLGSDISKCLDMTFN
jgi:hypothetical protein